MGRDSSKRVRGVVAICIISFRERKLGRDHGFGVVGGVVELMAMEGSASVSASASVMDGGKKRGGYMIIREGEKIEAGSEGREYCLMLGLDLADFELALSLFHIQLQPPLLSSPFADHVWVSST